MTSGFRLWALWPFLPLALIAVLCAEIYFRTKPTDIPALSMEILEQRASLMPLQVKTRASAPLTATWEMPMGTRHGAFIYNAQSFGEPNHRRGGLHLGDDLNGIGQENTDLGDPVFAPANGLVVYAGHASSGWGGVIILLHRTPEGERQSLYGHLDPNSIKVKSGETVYRGMKLGAIALTTAVDYAHLHYEWRSGSAVAPGAGYAESSTLNSLAGINYIAQRLNLLGLPIAK